MLWAKKMELWQKHFRELRMLFVAKTSNARNMVQLDGQCKR
jgi:hypothetical protein